MKPAYFGTALRQLVSEIEWSDTNEITNASKARELYISTVLTGLAKSFDPKDKLKAMFEEQLQKPTLEDIELIVTRDVTLSVKVNSPRATFDKAMFIKEVALKYEIPSTELFNIAESCVKLSANVVTFKAEVNNG